MNNGLSQYDKLKKIFQSLPKCDLHVHLRGAMPINVFCALVNKYRNTNIIEITQNKHRLKRYLNNKKILNFINKVKLSACKKEFVYELFEFTNIEDFLSVYGFTVIYIRSIYDFNLLIEGVIEEFKRQNIVYAEITISLCEYLRQGLAVFAKFI